MRCSLKFKGNFTSHKERWEKHELSIQCEETGGKKNQDSKPKGI